jgi:hypothetical protein
MNLNGSSWLSLIFPGLKVYTRSEINPRRTGFIPSQYANEFLGVLKVRSTRAYGKS